MLKWCKILGVGDLRGSTLSHVGGRDHSQNLHLYVNEGSNLKWCPGDGCCRQQDSGAENMPNMPKSPKCINPVCIPCAVSFMNTYLDSTHSHNTSHNHDKHAHKNHGRSKTVSPPKARKEALVTEPKSKSVGASESDKETIKISIF